MTESNSIQGMLTRMHEVDDRPPQGTHLMESAGFGWDGEIEIEPIGGGGSATFMFCRANGDVGFTFRVVPDVGPNGSVAIGDFKDQFTGYIDGEAPSTAEEAFKVAERHGRVAGWKIASQPMSEGADPFSGFDPAVAHYIGLIDHDKIGEVLDGLSNHSDGARSSAQRAWRSRDASAKHGEDSPSNNRMAGMTYGDEARKEMKEFIHNGTQLAFRCRQFLKLWEND